MVKSGHFLKPQTEVLLLIKSGKRLDTKWSFLSQDHYDSEMKFLPNNYHLWFLFPMTFIIKFFLELLDSLTCKVEPARAGTRAWHQHHEEKPTTYNMRRLSTIENDCPLLKGDVYWFRVHWCLQVWSTQWIKFNFQQSLFCKNLCKNILQFLYSSLNWNL